MSTGKCLEKRGVICLAVEKKVMELFVWRMRDIVTSQKETVEILCIKRRYQDWGRERKRKLSVVGCLICPTISLVFCYHPLRPCLFPSSSRSSYVRPGRHRQNVILPVVSSRLQNECLILTSSL
ncbi:hypothetical protein BDV27DRAFT_121489, partial [Aspergillus caelatus]